MASGSAGNKGFEPAPSGARLPGATPAAPRHFRWIVALVSIAAAIGLAEAMVRVSLFHTTLEFASQDPEYYARSLDELWIYRHLFSGAKSWTVGVPGAQSSNETSIEFYRKWAASLTPDPELGYVRAPDIRTPCHETTNLATRGAGEASWVGPKIVFVGDSFVESAACPNDTLPTKVQKLTGIDTLNFGVGGYGVDQMFLYFKRLAPRCDRKDCSRFPCSPASSPNTAIS